MLCWHSSLDLKQDLPHRSLREPRECRGKLIEGKYSVYDRTRVRARQQRDDLAPGGAALVARVGANRDAAELKTAEEERGGIETRHRTGQRADATDAPML